jgi:hypothetical protein
MDVKQGVSLAGKHRLGRMRANHSSVFNVLCITIIKLNYPRNKRMSIFSAFHPKCHILMSANIHNVFFIRKFAITFFLPARLPFFAQTSP